MVERLLGRLTKAEPDLLKKRFVSEIVIPLKDSFDMVRTVYLSFDGFEKTLFKGKGDLSQAAVVLEQEMPVFTGRYFKRRAVQKTLDFWEDCGGSDSQGQINERMKRHFPTFVLCKGEKEINPRRRSGRVAMIMPGIDGDFQESFDHAVASYEHVIRVDFPEEFSELSLAGYMAFFKFWAEEMVKEYGRLDVVAFSFSGGALLDMINALFLREMKGRLGDTRVKRPQYLINQVKKATRRVVFMSSAIGFGEIHADWGRYVRGVNVVVDVFGESGAEVLRKVVAPRKEVGLNRPRYLEERKPVDKIYDELRSLVLFLRDDGKIEETILLPSDYYMERFAKGRGATELIGVVGVEDTIVNLKVMTRLRLFGVEPFKRPYQDHSGPFNEKLFWKRLSSSKEFKYVG
jgi:hypothetical protein